jgi:undecaprenyl-diphosphatase
MIDHLSTRAGRHSSLAKVLACAMAAAFITLLLLGFGLGELSESTAAASDLDAVQDVASDRSAPLTTLAHIASTAGSAFVLVPITLIICGLLWQRGARSTALFIAISFAGATAISSLDKILVGRPRPPVRHLEAVTSGSFPSGHTTEATAFCAALLLTFLATRPRRGLAVLAAIVAAAAVAAVAFSRIYLGVHYPTDIAGGLVLGGGWTVIVYALLSKADRGRDTQATVAQPQST